MNFKDIKEKWSSFWASPSGKVTAKVLRYVFMAFILGYLVYQIYEIGWVKVLRSLPTSPWYYLLFFILYFSLPISEQFIYRLSLKFSFWEGFKVFVEKKILNADVLGYSGEAYFYVWGKQNLEEDHKHIFNVIKDNNIISSFSSTLMAVLLLTIFIYIGQVNILDFIEISQNVVIGISVLAVIIIVLGIYFKDVLISMDRNTALMVFGIHTIRIVFVYALEVLQWIIIMPEVPLHVWSLFLAARIAASRIPFIPSQDLLFVTISVAISSQLDVDTAGVFGLMVASTFLTKCLSFILYSYFVSTKKIKKAS